MVSGLQGENDQLRANGEQLRAIDRKLQAQNEQLRANDRKLQAENEQLRDEVQKLSEILVRITDSGEGGFYFVLKCLDPI